MTRETSISTRQIPKGQTYSTITLSGSLPTVGLRWSQQDRPGGQPAVTKTILSKWQHKLDLTWLNYMLPILKIQCQRGKANVIPIEKHHNEMTLSGTKYTCLLCFTIMFPICPWLATCSDTLKYVWLVLWLWVKFLVCCSLVGRWIFIPPHTVSEAFGSNTA